MNNNKQKPLKHTAGLWMAVTLITVVLARLGLSEQDLRNDEYKRFNRFVSWSA
ncbi:MAG: hypothetical protein PHO37_00185 [Kiritimatiellae bacterium]|nr:hypothetical protein [Kiritimatiellia bacterium]